MSIACYRGVPYNTDRNISKEFDYKKVEEVYRGTKHTEVVKVEVVK